MRAGQEPEVVIFKTLGATRRAPRRRPKRAPPDTPEPDPLGITRVTVVAAGALPDDGEATAWLDRCRRGEETRDDECDAGLRSINRVLSAHRRATADPYVREVTRAQAQRVLLGYGTGEELVGGRWQAAYLLPARRRRERRGSMLAPQEELTAILAGRQPSHPSEELALRARLDLDQRRFTEAALQLAAALKAREREAESEGAGEVGAVRAQREVAEKLAAAALRGDLSDDGVEALDELVAETMRAMRRRRYRDGAASATVGEPAREGDEDRAEPPLNPPAASKLEQ